MYRINTVKNMIIDKIIMDILDDYLGDTPYQAMQMIKDEIIDKLSKLSIDELLKDLYS